MTGTGLSTEPDHVLARGLCAGDATAVRLLVARHNAVADLLAVAAAAPAGPGDTVFRAWSALRVRVADGGVHADLRAQLLGLVIDELADADLLDQTPADPLPTIGPFLPDGDRWAGWWADDGPAAWPDGPDPDPEQIVRGLRRLPLGPRVLLVLRDAAGLDPQAVAEIIGQSHDWQAVTLHQARDAFVTHLDREVAA